MFQGIDSLAQRIAANARDLLDQAFLIQLAIIVVLALVARFIAPFIEGRLEVQLRRIKGQPTLLRILATILRRTTLIVYVTLLLLALAVIRGVEGPMSGRVVAIILTLAAAWLVIRLVSRIVRNRLVARLLSWGVWAFVLLTVLGVNDDAAQLLDGLALPLGDTRLSALTILKAVLLLTATLWVAILAGNFLDERVKTSTELSPSIRVLVGKFVKIGLVLIAGTVALSSVGVNLTALTVFSSAVGVGLGFGLQKVVSNFISGVIILLDKSIKPGDTISVGETFGWIRELRARFVSVVTRDGREYLIPNEDFITQRVVNWSFTDDLVRLDIAFGVAYASDPHQVTNLAIEAAAAVARVESDRRPVCWITGFGDSSIDFVLRFWIHDPQQGLTNVRGRVYLALWDTFKANGIEIPFPQRELTVKRAPVHDRATTAG